jgi:amidohydrolase
MPDLITRPSAPPTDLEPSGSLIAIRRHLHRNPELGFEEYETASFIRDTLAREGFAPVAVAETGTYVDIVGARPGPLVGYRADIDALPIHDLKDVPYASQRPGVAHLCGHDAHTAIGIGVARNLAARRDEIAGTARVFFQPNEEGTPSGAPHMIDAGVIDGMAAVMAVHVDPMTEVGQFGLISGPATASTDRFDITVRSQTTGHSARPHEVTDTVFVANTLLGQIYSLAGRRTDARRAAVFTACRIASSTDAYNVIPREVAMGGTLRCVDLPTRRDIRTLIERTASHVANLHDCEIEVVFHNGAPPVENHPDLAALVGEAVVDLYGERARKPLDLPSMGAEDFAFYTQQIPGLLVRVGTRSSPETSHPVHDASFDLDERALAPTARLMAEALIRRGQQG